MKKGFIALPLILLISGIVLEITLALALISYYLVQMNSGSKFSSEAFSLAATGIDDAFIKIIRKGDYSGSYTIIINSSKRADVVVCRELKTIVISCDTQNDGKSEITSTGVVFNKYRRLRAYLNVDSNQGIVTKDSLEEIPIN